MKGLRNLVMAMWGLEEKDADVLFGEMDLDILQEAVECVVNVDNIEEIWEQCIEIAATNAGVNDSSWIKTLFNYAKSHVFIYREFVEDVGAEKFTIINGFFHGMTGFNLEVIDC